MPRRKTKTVQEIAIMSPTPFQSFLNINIQPFSGDPELVTFFFDQILEFQNLNKLSDEKTLLYFRSKLSNNALTFYIQSTDCKNAKSISELKDIFQNFFAKEDSHTALDKLNKFHALQGENVRSIAHRLDSLFSKAYPTLLDPNAINTLKTNIFLNSIVHEVKLTILKEGLKTYSEIITRAQALYNIILANPKSDNMIPPTSTSNSEIHVINALQADIKQLEKKIDSMKDDQQQRTSNQTNHSRRYQNYPHHQKGRHRGNNNNYRPSFQRRNNFKNFSQNAIQKGHEYNTRGPQRSVTQNVCPYCMKRGHILKNCYQFQNVTHARQNKPNFSNSQLNPRAPEYQNLNQ